MAYFEFFLLFSEVVFIIFLFPYFRPPFHTSSHSLIFLSLLFFMLEKALGQNTVILFKQSIYFLSNRQNSYEIQKKKKTPKAIRK